MKDSSDAIQLVLPFKADYVSIARLAASGIASRMGFDIDTVEDIKVAVSEVCNKLVQIPQVQVDRYSILFDINHRKLTITFKCEDENLGCIFGEDEEELGVSIINALMDEVLLCSAGKNILSMMKAVEGNTEHDRS